MKANYKRERKWDGELQKEMRGKREVRGEGKGGEVEERGGERRENIQPNFKTAFLLVIISAIHLHKLPFARRKRGSGMKK